ncbi:polyprenyl synthetase family protein [Cryptosporangium phraense]|uniref:Polyprenyl synthetase family protein n=1 Tax=Cryptosporangium phraense TaxID=2593070 RepID=A0A545AUB4_9ACTN|nr:polyprenyl synthetase family protein [Cryptosporangium phraense]TQS44927.1 polyprenyl synthetase family protein [Cryptosporangium phraense]
MNTRAAGMDVAPTGTGLLGIEAIEPEFAASVRAGLGQVENALLGAVADADPLVSSAARHLVEAGGKRFRPLLALSAAHFGNHEAPDVVQAAVVAELTHLATLYHDDVMDEAPVRRGAPSANARWTNTIAILTGDYLFARASDLVADLGPDAVRLQARTFARLVTGQIRETAGPAEGADAVEFHLHVLEEKTGSLIATSLQFGAMFSGCGPAITETLTAYGEEIGVAFQLSDDLLDIASTSAESGKTPGTDLREGVPTLAVLHALAGDDPSEARMRELISRPITDDDEVAEALALLRESPAMASARATLAAYAQRARDLLGSLPDVPARRALESLTYYVIDRTS